MSEQDQMIMIPMPMGGNPGVPQMQRSDRADLIDKIDPKLIVETMRNRLLGKDLVNGTWTTIPALQDRALTDVGAWEISNLILGTASINVSISKLTDIEIKRRALRIAKTTQYMCCTNWRKYGIKNSSQLWYVHEIVFTNALVVLKQADDASIQELLKGTVTENRNVNSEAPKQPGKLRRFLGL